MVMAKVESVVTGYSHFRSNGQGTAATDRDDQRRLRDLDCLKRSDNTAYLPSQVRDERNARQRTA